jgi:hypothetical protein
MEKKMRLLFLTAGLSMLVGASFAGAAVVVVPNANATTGGDAQGPAPFSYYGSTGSHDQELYPSSQFSSFGGAQTITGIQFRPYPGSATSAFTSGSFTVSNVTISLSTTPSTEAGAAMLSSTYADNVGADSTVVYTGPLTLTTTATDAPGGATKIFDYSVTLQNGFSYNPSLGNLLLDVNIPSGAIVSGAGFGFLTFDNVNDIGDGVASIISSGTPGAAGSYSTSGAITQFTYASVPEPASISLIVFAAGAILHRRRSR